MRDHHRGGRSVDLLHAHHCGTPVDLLIAPVSRHPDRRDERECRADPEALWSVVTGIGGARGWYSFPLAWSVRGWLDKLAGGVGLRRGRRDKQRLRVGEALDWWRVEEVDDLALGSAKIAPFVGGKTPRKVIYVPGRLINIVV